MMRVYWHNSANFGDALTPYLVEKLTGKVPEWSEPAPDVFLVTGSIFGYNVRQGVVWGAGCAFQSDLDPTQLSPPSESFRVIATRGPLSRALVRAAGHEPVTCGDPGFLVPRVYVPSVEKKRKLGIIYSWVDEEAAQRIRRTHMFESGYSPRRVGPDDLLCSLTPVERVVDFIRSSEYVVSSCLHGIVLSVAYGVPVRYHKFSDKMIGDGFKFRDAYELLDVDGDDWIFEPSRANEIAEELLKCCPLPNLNV